ncbi:MAG: PP0621 family protein [Ketobacteraceae bacterium]|nr:PP0621 family protein [Ketobacteraceae bacterium]
MLFRLILFVVICGLAYSLYKKLQKGNTGDQNAKDAAKAKDEPPLTMKRCAKCGVHLPEKDSIQYQTLHFCCEDHKKSYLEDHSSGDDPGS